jgi:hypothetical protein
MSEDMKVGNQNEVLNDYGSIIQKNMGAIDKAVQDINNLKTPSVNGGGGADSFNLMTDVMMAKAGPAGFMAQLHADLGLNSGVENSAFFGHGSAKRPRTKKEAALAAKVRMLMSNSNPVTGKLTRQQNLTMWKEVRRELAGVGKSKNPMMNGGSGLDFMGNKTGSGGKKRFPTKADIMNNMNQLDGLGLGEIRQNIETANYCKSHRTLFEDILGAEAGWEEAKASLKTQQKDEVVRIAAGMTLERRDTLMQDVLSAEHYLLLKIQEGRAGPEHDPLLRQQEEEKLEKQKEMEQEHHRQREIEAQAFHVSQQIAPPAPLAPPMPDFGKSHSEKEKEEKERWS